MSSFSKKLQRIQQVGPSSPTPSPSFVPEEETSPVRSSDSLEALREKIAKIVGRTVAPPPAPSSRPPRTLPFVEHPTPEGSFFQHLMSLDPQHHVGRFPIRLAQSANSATLGLLALDPCLASIDIQRVLYLDTETTGLAGGTGTLPFLVGMGSFSQQGAFVVEQLLLRAPGEEYPLLRRLLDNLQRASAIVTFNGKTFDLPLLRTRLVMNRLPPMPALPHLDLLHVARRIHKTRIGSCHLGAVESRVLGFERVGDVPSDQIAGRYFHFLRTGDEEGLVDVVSHNVWDIVSMAALVGLYGEPLSVLPGEDLAGVAATVARAQEPAQAAEIADIAVEKGGGVPALRLRATLAKARGDRQAALQDFETLEREVDDPGVRLELAKLYEHHLKAYGRAIRVVE
ncbi:MAG TPA: ribonuclease H-like domain-containing protein, partial [Polyangiaceae bacterium]|nr:ribonuclease H-like domain-containing protein [Polyangiaceae bacterium]